MSQLETGKAAVHRLELPQVGVLVHSPPLMQRSPLPGNPGYCVDFKVSFGPTVLLEVQPADTAGSSRDHRVAWNARALGRARESAFPRGPRAPLPAQGAPVTRVHSSLSSRGYETGAPGAFGASEEHYDHR